MHQWCPGRFLPEKNLEQFVEFLGIPGMVFLLLVDGVQEDPCLIPVDVLGELSEVGRLML